MSAATDMEKIDQALLYVTGKGGVGKSAAAALLALKLAERGKKVLLVELGDESYYGDLWGINAVGQKPVKTDFGFYLSQWTGESCLREYVLHYIKIESVYRLFFENRVMSSFLGVAPAVNELSIVGKLTSKLRGVGPEMEFDHIVVDAFATGHSLALLQAPYGMAHAVSMGPMGNESRQMQKVLEDPKLIRFFVVSLLEELPVAESLELSSKIQSLVGQKPDLIINKRIEPPVEDQRLFEIIEKAQAPELVEFTRYIMGLKERQRAFEKDLSGKFAQSYTIPMIYESHPKTLLKKMGEKFRCL